MTDKVQKIKDWISKTQDGLMDTNGNFEYPEHEGAYHILCSLDYYIHSLQEEPVSEELEEAAKEYSFIDGADDIEEYARYDIKKYNSFKVGAEWCKNQVEVKIQAQSMALAHECPKELVSEDLEDAAGKYAYELFPSVGVANTETELAFKAGANWQKEQMEKNRLAHCDALTAEQAQVESDFVVQHLKKNNRTPTFIDAIEYGIRLQKEQMMAKAADATIGVPYKNNRDSGYIHLVDVSRPLPVGNNKIAIIFKEE